MTSNAKQKEEYNDANGGIPEPTVDYGNTQENAPPQEMTDNIGEAVFEAEFEAMATVYDILSSFPPNQADRMLQWVIKKMQAKNQAEQLAKQEG